MAYTKQTWTDGAAGNTPVSADRLNHMEQGISDGSGGNPVLQRTVVNPSVPPVAANVAVIPLANYSGPLVYGSGGATAYMVYKGDIAPGTWAMRFWYCKLSNVGIVNVDYSFDNVTWATAIASLDQYAPTATYLQFADASITVPASIYTIYIRCISLGKNPSSSAYIPVMGETHFVRTA